jgi:amino acid transporter
MTVLSYVATAVLSAKVGVEYALSVLPIHEITIPGIGPLQAVIPITIGLLLFFALLVISGLKDSAKVAFGIFIFHVITLTSFLILGGWYFFHGTSYFHQNLQYTFSGIINQKGLLLTLYFAFSASLLGVSGFESSANFVEEQKKGVFRKTLRNMLIGVAIFNPLIALVVLNAMPYAAVKSASDFLLADAARSIGGQVFQYVVVVDAFLVSSKN